MRRHALRLLRLLGRRCQAWSALGCAACHYAAKEVARSMADLGRLGL